MYRHSESGEASRQLCNVLVAELHRNIQQLRRVQSAGWCDLWEEGRKSANDADWDWIRRRLANVSG